MKNTITHTAEWILVAILGILLCYTAYKAYTLRDKVEYITTDTITVTDTIIDWKYDTSYVVGYDTVQLPVVDYRYDTIIKLDSILVQVPISTTIYDTTIQDTAHTTHIRAQISGFLVNADSLYLNTKIMHQEPQIPSKKWYENLGIGAGLGVTYKDGFLIGPMIGIMYNF